MEFEQFMEYGNYFGNLSYEQLEEILDFDGIEDLPDNPDTVLALEALGQYLSGNTFDPAITFSCLNNDLDRRRFVDTWFSVIGDWQVLKKIEIFLGIRLA